MNESEPTIITKIRSSLLLISGCRFEIAADKEIELTDEFITVPIDKGKETIIVSLSFKHVNRIELLDNRECKGAGMILYINEFMATKLQCVLDENGTKLLDYKTPYSSEKFIVLDILNSDIRNLNRINNILYKAGMFHHSYLIKQMNSRKKAKIDIPFEFLSIISHCQWVAALSLSGIDPGKIEPVQFVHENGCHVATLLPNKKPKIKVQNFDQQMSVLEYIRLRQLQPVTTEKQTSKQKQTKHEIHLLDDDDTEETKPCVSKDENEIVLSFPPNSKDTCSVHYSDLKYLAIDVMLNDTIIDFYLKYIHHSIIPKERRDNIFIFTTFFFARLTQAPAHGKQQVTMATKLKRVNSNFQSLRNWTKKVDLFAKDYIVVPINEDIHWYLAIIVKPRAAIYSTLTKKPIMESGKPFVIVFNSLIDPALDKHIEVRNQLAEYLYLEFKDKYLNKSPSNGDKCFVKEALQVIQPPLIPQQKGYIDCGLFLLHFAELFLTKPPKKINDKTSFRRWFPDFQIRDKRHQIKEVIRILSPKIKNSDFIYYPPLRSNNPKRSKKQQPSALEALQLVRRERKQSDTVIDEIQKDSRFSVLYRPRSLDSLIKENKEKPLVLQPPTIFEMKRYKKQKI